MKLMEVRPGVFSKCHKQPLVGAPIQGTASETAARYLQQGEIADDYQARLASKHHEDCERIQDEWLCSPKCKVITFFICGGGCPKGGEHQWDGPEKIWDTGGSTTCSKCGLAQIDYDMMNAL